MAKQDHVLDSDGGAFGRRAAKSCPSRSRSRGFDSHAKLTRSDPSVGFSMTQPVEAPGKTRWARGDAAPGRARTPDDATHPHHVDGRRVHVTMACGRDALTSTRTAAASTHGR